MFDIGFSELLLVGIVALLVLGPERLPEAVRASALWWGRLKRSMTAMKTEFEREIGADEIRRQLHNETILANLKKAEQELQATQQRIQHLAQDTQQSVQQSVRRQIDHGAAEPSDRELPDSVMQDDQRDHSDVGQWQDPPDQRSHRDAGREPNDAAPAPDDLSHAHPPRTPPSP